ncbi:MAG: hypothetical protein QOH25_2680 [Acidobacteriota bacterium]|jgi:hypothetical protein|nr:hypothetical protein [Acidobacteriota bacterium]
MSTGRFLQAFAIALAFTFLTSAATSGETVSLSRRADAHHYLENTKELSKTPGNPDRLEKFILKPAETTAPSDIDTVDAKAGETPEATRPGDNSSMSGTVNLSIPAQPLFSNSSRRLTLIDKTYLDAYAILQKNNSCSYFFGGPRIATGVLNSLHPRLKAISLRENQIGITMFGPTTLVTNFQTGASYRLFKEAVVNLTGPFYRVVDYHSQGLFRKSGHYSANTREARVLMLLHELGHLLSGPNGRWLLPDDGNSRSQADANTTTIMDKCSEQINSLSLQRADTPSLKASANS